MFDFSFIAFVALCDAAYLLCVCCYLFGLNTCLCLGGCGVVYLSFGVVRVWCFLSVSFGRCCLVVVV